MTPYETLLTIAEGQNVKICIVDFENTEFPKDENPRTISGKVTNVKEDVSHSAGEIQRTVTIGNPWEDGCLVDLGDTSKNQMTGGLSHRKYLKAWRPRAGKDRLLLGRVDSATDTDN